jgi:metal-dependent HD superfamily phosphatase/phosphodiesterase
MKSPKEMSLEKKLLGLLDSKSEAHKLAVALIADEQIQDIQDYANNVSIKRLGFNDHGPVHMRQVALNSIVMLDLLRQAGIRTCLEAEEQGSYDDSACAILLGSFLHDIGMSIGRQDHELYSSLMARPIIERLLEALEISNKRKAVISCMSTECIVGHMATRRIHSIEAGLILIADGCDMTKGRSRIPISMNTAPQSGDIHKFSAASIEGVDISKGKDHPIRISVKMDSELGLFQIEEVLLPKISMSPSKEYVEVVAKIKDKDERRYL